MLHDFTYYNPTKIYFGKIAETSYEGGGYKYMTHEDILNVLKACF